MIDAEVVRLRKLRNVALGARALAKILDADSRMDNSIYAKSAVTCWTIARIATGHLRSHPYLSYQKDPSRIRELADRSMASTTAFVARRQNRCLSVCALELQRVAREVNDVRALTWSPNLSDALGRTQLRLRRLAEELDVGVQNEPGSVAVPRMSARARAEVNGAALEGMSADNGWPYLAI